MRKNSKRKGLMANAQFVAKRSMRKTMSDSIIFQIISSDDFIFVLEFIFSNLFEILL